tara:strand:- start:7832 stop:8698 length:867 start_codon:yes stop_codon:yes gene_type:complete
LSTYKVGLITGATGFIGSSIAKEFNQNDLGIKWYTPTSNELPLFDKNYTIKTIQKIQPDLVIHCAALLPFKVGWENSKKGNILIDTNLVNALKLLDKNVKIIYCSGVSLYNNTGLELTEKSPLEAKNVYFESKILGENLIRGNFENTVILRISAPYGPSQKIETVLQKFVRLAKKNQDLSIYGDGSRVQNFTLIDDVVEAVKKVITLDATGVYNIASNASITMKKLAETIISVLKSDAKISTIEVIEPDVVVPLNVSNSKAKKQLGWYPSTKLADGIKKFKDESGDNI